MKAERESDGERARESGGIFSFKRVTGCNITYSEPLRDAHGNQLESGHYRNSRRVVRAAFKIKPGSLFKSHFSWYAPKTPFMCLSLVSFFSHGCQSTCKACSLREGKPASRVEGRNLIFCEHWWYQYSCYLLTLLFFLHMHSSRRVRRRRLCNARRDPGGLPLSFLERKWKEKSKKVTSHMPPMKRLRQEKRRGRKEWAGNRINQNN